MKYREMGKSERFALNSPIMSELLSDIMFMLYYVTNKKLEDKPKLLYFYNEEVKHLNILLQFFPNVEYHIYDGSVIEENLNIPDNTTVYFHDVYDEIEGEKFLIHRLPSRFTSEEDLLTLLDEQRDLVESIKATYSIIDIEFPYVTSEEKKYYDYLGGYIFFRPFSRPTSTRTKLIRTPNMDEFKYNLVDYEERLYYHNIMRTEIIYNDPITDGNNFRGEGYDIDNSYDSIYLLFILYAYYTASEEQEGRLEYKLDKIMKYKEYIVESISTIEGRFFETRLLDMMRGI